jgi:putative ABC transport system permease protein
MKLRRSLGLSWRALFSHRLRALLALASVAVGVAAVFLTSAIGAGAGAEVTRRLEEAGTNLLVVRPAQVRRLAARKDVSGQVTTLKPEDADAIEQLAPIADVAPAIEGALRVKAGRGALITKVIGTTPAFQAVKRVRLASGRFFDRDEQRLGQRVAVIGNRVREQLLGDADPIGATIRIRGVPFEVVGLQASKGVQADGSDEDGQVLIPLRTASRRVFNVPWLSNVFASARDPKSMPAAAGEITALLRDRHGLARKDKADDFSVQDRDKFLLAQKQVADTLTLFTSGLATVALLVGGFGILALMFLSVKERTGEIGLRLAVGARPRDILVQFLLEATILAMTGWLAGIATGAAASAAVALATGWTMAWPLKAAAASLMMAAATGLGFGALPARKASRLPPIQALAAD